MTGNGRPAPVSSSVVKVPDAPASPAASALSAVNSSLSSSRLLHAAARAAARVAGAGVALALAVGVPAAPVLAAPTVPTTAPAPVTQSTPTGSPGSGSVPRKGNATFGLQPVTNGRIDGRSEFAYQTGPGGAYQDAFAVVNYGDQPLHLAVYAADLTNNADGGLVVGGATDPKRGASTWIRLPAGLTGVDLPAASGRTGASLERIPFAWVVPTGAAAGDHTAAIVASLTVQSTGKNGEPVRLDQRVALRVFFRVSGTIAPQLTVSDFRVVYSGTWNPVGSGEARVSYTLTNSGNVRLGATQSLASSAWLGAGGTPDAIPDEPLLLPGGSVHVDLVVHHVFPGIRLTEKLHIDPVRAVDDVNVHPTPLEVQASTWAILWPLIVAVLALLVLIGLVIRWWRRRRRNRPQSRHGAGRDRTGPQPDDGSDDGPGPDGIDQLEDVLSTGGAE